MSNFFVKVETLKRFQNIVKYYHPRLTNDVKKLINTIRLENHNGKSFIIATNAKIGAVEYLGETNHPDGVCHLKLDRLGGLTGETAELMVIPQAVLSTLTAGGEVHNDVCHWFDDTPLDRWREWASPPATESTGAMLWDLYMVETLFKSSPSGEIVFPEFIDSSKALTLRDRTDPNWVGLFKPEPYKDEPRVKPATLPEWWS